MARYIDETLVNAKLKEICENTATAYGIVHGGRAEKFERLTEDIPTADVVEVKHGEWILEYGTYGKMICSECKNEAPITNKRDNSLQLQTLYVDSPYCHHCGAKMKGSEN